MESGTRVRNPLFQPYREVQHLLKCLQGVPREVASGMLRSIQEQRGTPQDPVAWSDPDSWIAERLDGPEADLARGLE